MSETSGPNPNSRLGRWLPGELPPEGARAARIRLAAAIRRMNNLLIDADLPEEELLRAAVAAEAFADRIGRAPRDAVHWGFAEASNAGSTGAFFDRSPVIGLGNAIAPPLTLSVEDDRVVGRGTFGTAYEGPPGHVHGGWVAAAFDEVLGMAQSLTGNSGMTGSLIVRYRRPTPLHRPLVLTGTVDRVDGRKIFTIGALLAGDTLCAEAEGVFISVDPGRFRVMADTAVGPGRSL